ncbi:ethylbenzene dehydrogenase-related protein [Thioalkalivibrio paradoxus]|uniref:Cytochrome C552 n=1 Tax=Thioalkalivibrio paradoxus ARh 1 TaxID=713585 RepID=W0DLX5_9GAMM|nr:ethylbenzene dehydrogenase-related protein [Thioalkalivibrio paradoxus]AHE98237.1 cytochrome C552 [Thioalkalivibrio paradoxus ARh 1]
MLRRRSALLAVSVLFVAVLLVSLVTHGTGVIQNDPARNIWVPGQLTLPLQLQVAFNDDEILFRYRWPADRPHRYADLLRFTDGRWQRVARSPIGPDPDGLTEDRLTMMVDDGSVPEFQRYGGYITVGADMRDFTPQDAALGEEDGYRRKYLPATRTDPQDWYSIADAATLHGLHDAGYFLDLWHWRAQLSNPIGRSDDQHISWYRLYDSGDGPFTSNWDGAAQRPRLMFDPERTGIRALRWEDVTAGHTDSDIPYHLAEAKAVPFDRRHEWREGDVIPGQVLREPSGARAAIRVQGEGRWTDGHWDVTLRRALDTGHPLEDKILHPKGVYDIAVAVHRDGTASRWHYVSMPLQIGLDRPAEWVASRFDGDVPDWDRVPVHEIELFYPGQVSWPRLTSEIHAGAPYIAKGVPVKFRHKEAQLAQYGVEIEFEREIRRQWWLSLIAGLVLIASFVLSVSLILGRERS